MGHPCQDNGVFGTLPVLPRVGGTMTIADFCIFGAVVLYLLTIVPIKWIGYRNYDNAKPRDPAFYSEPLRARALAAHQNGLETFPFFAVAVLFAEFRGAPQHLINELAVLFLIVRIAYVLTYIGNRPRLRIDPLEHRLCDQRRDFLPAGCGAGCRRDLIGEREASTEVHGRV